MTLLKRLFAPRSDPRDALRPLWQALVAEARLPHWYAERGVADTLEGRFDMVSTVLALALLRMERAPALAPRTALLTEIFVEEMDGQLRQTGVGDLMVGKQIGRLMATLGGRVGALRPALEGEREGVLEMIVQRNVTMADTSRGRLVAEALRSLAARLAATGDDALLEGRIG